MGDFKWVRSLTIAEIERFVGRYTISDSGCWEWGTTTVTGYGLFWLDGQYQCAHRVAYQMFYHNLSDKLTIDHLCRNRACVNPRHLEQVTGLENVRRGDAGKFWTSKTHCKHGHEFTEDNVYKHPRKDFARGWARVCRKCKNSLEADRRRRIKEKLYV